MGTIDKLNHTVDGILNIQNAHIASLIFVIGIIAGIKFFLKGGWYRYLGVILVVVSGFGLLIAVSPAFASMLI